MCLLPLSDWWALSCVPCSNDLLMDKLETSRYQKQRSAQINLPFHSFRGQLSEGKEREGVLLNTNCEQTDYSALVRRVWKMVLRQGSVSQWIIWRDILNFTAKTSWLTVTYGEYRDNKYLIPWGKSNRKYVFTNILFLGVRVTESLFSHIALKQHIIKGATVLIDTTQPILFKPQPLNW